jgi:uncharacterized protein YjiS (DUF1127 family)
MDQGEQAMLARNEWVGGVPAVHGIGGGHAVGRGLGPVLRLWRRRIRDREDLAAMSERDLRDVRLSRADVVAELRKPFWRA